MVIIPISKPCKEPPTETWQVTQYGGQLLEWYFVALSFFHMCTGINFYMMFNAQRITWYSSRNNFGISIGIYFDCWIHAPSEKGSVSHTEIRVFHAFQNSSLNHVFRFSPKVANPTVASTWSHGPAVQHGGKVVAAHVPELLVQTAPVAPALELEARGRIFQS